MPNEHRSNQRPTDRRNHRNLSEKDAARNEKPRTSVWNAVVFHRLAHCSKHIAARFLLVSRLAVGCVADAFWDSIGFFLSPLQSYCYITKCKGLRTFVSTCKICAMLF